MSLDLQSSISSEGLPDVLERILDKGVVIAGDVAISLVGIELLTIRLRLLIATVDKAREIGIDWWEHDPHLSSGASRLQAENKDLQERLQLLEAKLAQVEAVGTSAT